MRRIVGALLFICLFGIYAHQAAPSVTTGDAGEFMATAATLSLAHPPSYPLYSLAARVFAEVIPFGEFSYRTNIFSAFLSAAAATLLFFILTEAGLFVALGAGAALVFAFGLSFWGNALVTEVFSLNTFLAVLILFFVFRGIREIRFLDLGFLLLGLALANHQTILVMGPLLTWAAFRSGGFQLLARRGVMWSVLLVIGFSVNLYLPIRAAQEPPLNWGQPTTVDRVIRTLTRKDYGSFKLALGDAPARNVTNTKIQLSRFARQMNREWPAPLWVLALGGLLWAVYRKEVWAEAALGGFLLTGPLFYLLSNMPFTGQSEGVMGRFFILPTLFLATGFVGFKGRARWPLSLALCAAVLVMPVRGWAEAIGHRTDFLTLDYGRGMLRSLPRGAAFFMEGGDDAFYSLAYLHEAKGLRPDVEMHDRGALIYENVYGADFRKLTRDQKKVRRIEVEKKYLTARSLFYSTMDLEVIPGVPLATVGFLMEAGPATGPRLGWDHLILRSLYPPMVSDYRTRALAAFFPYMRGRTLMNAGHLDEGLAYWRRTAQLGADVDWVAGNLAYEYGHRAFAELEKGRAPVAEKIYRAWIQMNPLNYEARSNLGVTLQRQGKLEEALRENEQTAQLFPREADPLYNNAVVLWPTKDWSRITRLLEDALVRNPHHQAAASALAKIHRDRNPGAHP